MRNIKRIVSITSLLLRIHIHMTETLSQMTAENMFSIDIHNLMICLVDSWRCMFSIVLYSAIKLVGMRINFDYQGLHFKIWMTCDFFLNCKKKWVRKWQFKKSDTKLTKRDDFNFKIINFPNMCSNIPASPAYGVYISQMIRYARASSNYSDFLKRHLHLRNRLLDQGY